MHIFLILILFFLSGECLAQRRCGLDTLQQQKRTHYPQLYNAQEDFKEQVSQIARQRSALKISSGEEVYQIPVVVHVIYNNTASSNISEAQVASQIEVLNEDFRRMPGTNGFNTDPVGADTKIGFCLASRDPDGNFTSGIVRVYHSRSSWGVSLSDEVELKSLSYWPSDRYLNIWVCSMSLDYLGYAQYPTGSALPVPAGGEDELDGVVIDYRAFGRTGAAGTGGRGLYNMGRTTTHEVGHWLGLVHIWGDEDEGCATDHVADTPPDAGPNNDADCSDQSDCDNDNIFTPDMTSNYLDYSPDNCMNLFTEGQKMRMRTVIETAPRRWALINSAGCTPPLSLRPGNNFAEVNVGALLLGNEDVYCRIYDHTGREVFAGWLRDQPRKLPLENLNQGMYFIRAVTRDKQATQKIFKH